MFEEKTYENLLNDKLTRISDKFDKREGAIIYDAVAPNSAETAQVYIMLKWILEMTYADTATGEYLERRTSELGINREQPTKAIVKGVFEPIDVVKVGDRFSCDELNYIVTSIHDDYCELECETEGTIANGNVGQLIAIEYIQGLQNATITEVLKPAEDAETDDHLRARYFASLRTKAYGGNMADYEEKVHAIEGVGGVKVTPVWNGGGTVKLTLIDSDYNVPSQYLIDSVQNLIDPTQDGHGVGIAPIGHIVTVDGVTNVVINVETNITYADGWNYESTKVYIEKALDDYFLELRKEWEANTTLIVRIAQIETRLLACTGILDIADTTINGSDKNLQLGKYEVPTRGLFNGA